VVARVVVVSEALTSVVQAAIVPEVDAVELPPVVDPTDATPELSFVPHTVTRLLSPVTVEVKVVPVVAIPMTVSLESPVFRILIVVELDPAVVAISVLFELPCWLMSMS
jgi:hypothetical protein